jgi:membrane fusion protein, multidrug efflux system
MRLYRQISSFFLLAVLALLGGCSKQEHAAASAPAPAVPVTVATVEQKDIPVTIRAIGNVEPIEKVEIKSQIAGQVMNVHFKEGQDVRKGDLLFEIDPRQAQADLAKAQGQLARDKAAAANARADAARYASLFKEGVTSKQEYDRVASAAEQAEAAVAADEAALQNAKLQLHYTKITAPVSGRTGNLAVTEGNIVKSNEAVLVTINQINPIYVSFSIPEQQLDDVKRYINSGLSVEALPQGTPVNNGIRGKVTFVDNAVDQQTGTIRLKATFENAKGVLWPGQFADVVLTLTTQPNAISVPSAGINVGQNGQYAFVVGSDNTVEMRPVTVQRTFGDRSVISEGLKAGEKIVTDGQLRLTKGSRVEVKGTYQPPQPTPGVAGALPNTPSVPNTSLPAPSSGGATGASR